MRCLYIPANPKKWHPVVNSIKTKLMCVRSVRLVLRSNSATPFFHSGDSRILPTCCTRNARTTWRKTNRRVVWPSAELFVPRALGYWSRCGNIDYQTFPTLAKNRCLCDDAEWHLRLSFRRGIASCNRTSQPFKIAPQSRPHKNIAFKRGQTTTTQRADRSGVNEFTHYQSERHQQQCQALLRCRGRQLREKNAILKGSTSSARSTWAAESSCVFRQRESRHQWHGPVIKTPSADLQWRTNLYLENFMRKIGSPKRVSNPACGSKASRTPKTGGNPLYLVNRIQSEAKSPCTMMIDTKTHAWKQIPRLSSRNRQRLPRLFHR